MPLFSKPPQVQIGLNGAHNSFPHIRLTSTFVCPEGKSEELVAAAKRVAEDFVTDFSGESFKLEKYSSPNFLGLFVGKKEEILLRSFAQDLVQAFGELGMLRTSR